MEQFVFQIKETEVRRQVWSTPHLRTQLTNKKWKPCRLCTSSGSKILMNGQINVRMSRTGEEAKLKPSGNFFAKKRVVQAF